MGRISNSLQLAKTSWDVLRSDKRLTIIPVISAACSGVVMAAMGVGIFATVKRIEPSAASETFRTTQTGLSSAAAQAGYQPTPATYVVAIAGGLLLSIIVTYCTAALISAAHARLTGADGSIGAAFARATSRFPQLLGWAIINYTVGMVMRAINERAGIIGRLLTSALTLAWTVISWLTIPYIVIDGVGPISALKQSTTALKRTWGENLIANIGLGIINLFIFLGAVVLFAVFAIPGLWLVSVVVTLVYIAVAATIMSALTGIYRTALFMYASSGTVPMGFDQELLANAFRVRQRKLGVV
jgi:hypothetical protein